MCLGWYATHLYQWASRKIDTVHAVTHWLLPTVARVRPCTGQFSPVGSDFPHIAIYFAIALYFTILRKSAYIREVSSWVPAVLGHIGPGFFSVTMCRVIQLSKYKYKDYTRLFQVCNTKPIFFTFSSTFVLCFRILLTII